ncbi:hypothetical protein ACQPYK_49430 (plasmid) [Streptosporangium sp. CA-135522]|uniref:hypothetical protein n=1 Tax=Streptosporangium sp. CA-135522 TaxID=3240072 RepID=UPI003D8BC547
MISSEGEPFVVEGELADAVTAVDRDGFTARPFRIATADGATAVVISEELLLILQRAADHDAQQGVPLTIDDLATLMDEPPRADSPAVSDG